MENDKENSDYILRIYVKHNENESKKKHTRLIKVIRNPGKNDVQVYLPEEDEIVSTGWVPEIVYKIKEAGDILDIVISPKLEPFLARMKAEPEWNATGLKANYANNSEPRDPPGEGGKGHLIDEDVLYRVTFENREIRINGFKLSKPNFNSENEVVFDYIFRHPNTRIDLTEIELAVKRPINKRLREILRDVGFRMGLRNMFFPDVSKSAIKFVNPITKTDFEARGLKVPSIVVR